MCLGIPGEVVALAPKDGLRFALVRFAGVTREVCLELLPDASVGDYVVVHVGMAISTIDRAEAERAYRVLEELGETAELDPGRNSGGAA